MKIAIYTQDIELFDNIKLCIIGSNEFYLHKKNDNNIINDESDIIIIDNFNKKFSSLLKKIKKTKNIFYIGNDIKDETINIINTPFNLNLLVEKINDAINFFKKNIIKFDFGEFNFNNQTFTTEDKIIKFTEQENNFLKLIIENKNGIKKVFVMKNIWNNYDSEKLLDNLVYNIRKKLKSISIDNFILYENNNFFIGKNES